MQNFTGAQIEDDVLLQWQVDDDYSSCISFYNILIWNEDQETPRSLYMGENGYFLEHVAQCMNYRFQITAYYNDRNGTATQFEYTVPKKSK